jgi:hypothetical protein
MTVAPIGRALIRVSDGLQMYDKQNIPTIGAAKGLFEMLVPGVLLLLNISMTVYYFQGNAYKDTTIFGILTTNIVLILIIIIVMGYLIGVVLWSIGADWLDNQYMKILKVF